MYKTNTYKYIFICIKSEKKRGRNKDIKNIK